MCVILSLREQSDIRSTLRLDTTESLQDAEILLDQIRSGKEDEVSLLALFVDRVH